MEAATERRVSSFAKSLFLGEIHEDRSDSLKPPRAPTARMIATGPEAAKMRPISPFAM